MSQIGRYEKSLFIILNLLLGVALLVNTAMPKLHHLLPHRCCAFEQPSTALMTCSPTLMLNSRHDGIDRAIKYRR